MTKEEILDYVMSTPDNTNRRVLNDMIDELISSGGGGSDVFTVGISENYETGVLTMDKTAQELMNSGKPTVGVLTYEGAVWAAYWFIQAMPNEDSGGYDFWFCSANTSSRNPALAVTVFHAQELSDYPATA